MKNPLYRVTFSSFYPYRPTCFAIHALPTLITVPVCFLAILLPCKRGVDIEFAIIVLILSQIHTCANDEKFLRWNWKVKLRIKNYVLENSVGIAIFTIFFNNCNLEVKISMIVVDINYIKKLQIFMLKRIFNLKNWFSTDQSLISKRVIKR